MTKGQNKPQGMTDQPIATHLLFLLVQRYLRVVQLELSLLSFLVQLLILSLKLFHLLQNVTRQTDGPVLAGPTHRCGCLRSADRCFREFGACWSFSNAESEKTENVRLLQLLRLGMSRSRSCVLPRGRSSQLSVLVSDQKYRFI